MYFSCWWYFRFLFVSLWKHHTYFRVRTNVRKQNGARVNKPGAGDIKFSKMHSSDRKSYSAVSDYEPPSAWRIALDFLVLYCFVLFTTMYHHHSCFSARTGRHICTFINLPHQHSFPLTQPSRLIFFIRVTSFSRIFHSAERYDLTRSRFPELFLIPKSTIVAQPFCSTCNSLNLGLFNPTNPQLFCFVFLFPIQSTNHILEIFECMSNLW